MKKRILLTIAAIAAVAVSVVGMSAFEAHVINVTAKIENALAVNTYGIDFGTVFPQQNITDKTFDISLSKSFIAEGNADNVSYKIMQKNKSWTLNFGDPANDVGTHNRNLLFVDPDPGKGEGHSIAGGVLTITTGNDTEDLFGQSEVAGDWTAPRMVIPMGGNFTIETKVSANPLAYPAGGAYQSGGILVYGIDGNVVRLELTNFSGLGSTVVYMENQIASVKAGKGWNSLTGATTVYLRLSRTGDVFKGEYSSDGIAWNQVSLQEGNFTNASVGGHPQVGLAVTDNNEDKSNNIFSADFDYVTFNGDYLNLCRFLSKTKAVGEANESTIDINEESYFDGNGCSAKQGPATGSLNKTAGDTQDTWTVDLKVPPVAGYIGQDWPASCADWVVEQNSMDYGCDLWVEVTGINNPT